MMVLMAKRVPCQDYIDVEAKKGYAYRSLFL